jgi:hypothetical protein
LTAQFLLKEEMAALKEITNIKDIRAQIESKKFCFCLPVRLGVFVVSLLTMLAGSVVGVMGWMQVAKFQTTPAIEVTDEISAYIYASMFTLLGVLSIFGFAGSLVRARTLVIAYSVGLAIHLGLNIASGVFTMYAIFRPNPATSVDTCINAANPTPDLLEETRNICNTGMAIGKGIVVAIYVITWLLQLYAYFIVERYADQLEEEEFAALAAIMPQQPQHPTAYVGYPHRFSYGAYSDRRRSYDDRYAAPAYPHGQGQGGSTGDRDPSQDRIGAPRDAPERPRPASSEYRYSLPPQNYNAGAPRGKDASNLA